MSDTNKKRKPQLKVEGGGGRKKGTTSAGGRATARVPISDNITFEPYAEGWAAKGPWGDDGAVTGYGGTLTFSNNWFGGKKGGLVKKKKRSMKKGGTVKKCRMDGIALRGKTRAKERSK